MIYRFHISLAYSLLYITLLLPVILNQYHHRPQTDKQQTQQTLDIICIIEIRNPRHNKLQLCLMLCYVMSQVIQYSCLGFVLLSVCLSRVCQLLSLSKRLDSCMLPLLLTTCHELLYSKMITIQTSNGNLFFFHLYILSLERILVDVRLDFS